MKIFKSKVLVGILYCVITLALSIGAYYAAFSIGKNSGSLKHGEVIDLSGDWTITEEPDTIDSQTQLAQEEARQKTETFFQAFGSLLSPTDGTSINSTVFIFRDYDLLYNYVYSTEDNQYHLSNNAESKFESELFANNVAVPTQTYYTYRNTEKMDFSYALTFSNSKNLADPNDSNNYIPTAGDTTIKIYIDTDSMERMHDAIANTPDVKSWEEWFDYLKSAMNSDDNFAVLVSENQKIEINSEQFLISKVSTFDKDIYEMNDYYYFDETIELTEETYFSYKNAESSDYDYCLELYNVVPNSSEPLDKEVQGNLCMKIYASLEAMEKLTDILTDGSAIHSWEDWFHSLKEAMDSNDEFAILIIEKENAK